MVLGSNVGFNNLTSQIKNLTSDVVQYRDEIINKIEVRSPDTHKPLSTQYLTFQDTEQLLNHSLIGQPSWANESGFQTNSE